MTSLNMRAIQTATVGAGGASIIEFTNIPQTYTDLVIKLSSRINKAIGRDYVSMRFNSSTTTYPYRWVFGTDNGVSGSSSGSNAYGEVITTPGANATANAFGNAEIYIPNYAGSENKSFSIDSVVENNSSSVYIVGMSASRWSSNAAITSIQLYPDIPSVSASFVQHTTATLYGVTSAGLGAKATGGAIYQDNTYFYHVFGASGTFTPTQSISADILVVAGGGGGTSAFGGGGGAGGLLAFTGQSLTAQAYAITVGGGGAGGANNSNTVAGSAGGDSQFGSLTLVKGGGGAQAYEADTAASAANGGSGAGATYRESSRTNRNPFGTATSGQGNNGGSNNFASFTYASGGGGGAGAVGGSGAANSQGANGGDGTTAYSSWGLATGTGQNVGGTYYYAGGGAGGGGGASSPNNSRGGYGGGGNSVAGSSSSTLAIAGTTNTGGGGGGGSYSGGSGAGGASGGSGIVIVRYAK